MYLINIFFFLYSSDVSFQISNKTHRRYSLRFFCVRNVECFHPQKSIMDVSDLNNRNETEGMRLIPDFLTSYTEYLQFNLAENLNRIDYL